MHVWCSLSLSPLYPCLWEEGFRKHLHVFSCLLLQKNREQGPRLRPFPSALQLTDFLTEVLSHEDCHPCTSMISIQRDHPCPPPAKLSWDFYNPPPHCDKEFMVVRPLDLYFGYKGRFQRKCKLGKGLQDFYANSWLHNAIFFLS